MRLPKGFDRGMLPLLFAHRGLRNDYPENTFSAFKAARLWGVPGIELDVHITSDGKIVVIHDDDMKRVGGRDLRVEESTYADLKDIDIGSHLDGDFSDERIPLLEDVLAALGGDCYFDIELKNGVKADRGLAAAVAQVITRVKPHAPLIVSSFNPLELRRFHAVMPQISTAAIYSRDKDVPWYLRSGLGRMIGSADGYKPHEPLAKHRIKWSMRWSIPWTVNNKAAGTRLLKAGAIGLVSDDPRPFLQLKQD